MRQHASKVLGLMSITAFLFCISFPRTSLASCSELEFGTPSMYPGGLQTNGIVTGDLNGDGRMDIAAANEASGTITIRFGDGTGAFHGGSQFSTPSPTAIAIADFNGDGIVDLVTSNRTINAVTVRIGLGTGAFRPPIQIPVGPSPTGIAVADFSGDGNADLVTSNGGNSTISILIGNGTGFFASGAAFVVPGALGLTGIASADFNGDGRQDLATVNRSSSNISVMFAGRSGTSFTLVATYPAGGTQPNDMATADLNGDGRPDLVTVNSGGNNVIARINDGAGALTSAVSLGTGVEPFAVAVGDLDNNGHLDIVATNRRSRSISVFPGTGTGVFRPRKDFPLVAGPRAVAAADLDNNGTLDLATGIDSGHIAVLLNECSPNSPPTISGGNISRQQDAGSSNSAIATVSDDNDEPVALAVRVNSGTSATINGVTVSNITVSATGIVSADVDASCGASDALFLLSVIDSGGLSATAMLGVDVIPETRPPVINNGNPLTNITVYLPPNSPDTSMPVTFGLPTATDNCTVSPAVSASPVSGSVFPMGTTIVTVTAVDELGNTATSTFRVNVLLNFGGMLPPIDAFPALNTAAAGSAVPIQFSVGGYKGMNILAPGYPASSPVPCDAMAPGPTREETVANGGGLQYDPVTDRYKYVWKTMRSWKQSCRILILKLSDGSEHYARFSFR